MHNRQKLARHKFYTYCAEGLLNYRDDNSNGPVTKAAASLSGGNSSISSCTLHSKTPTLPDQHKPVPNKSRGRCMVCKLELSMNKPLGEKGLASHVADCEDKECVVRAHWAQLPDSNRKIHTLPEFSGMTCFEIAHSRNAQGMWSLRPTKKTTKTMQPIYTHPIYQELRVLHGLDPVLRRNTKKRKETNDSTTGTAPANNFI